jgi:RimJ/RimL family protein N-acetyltransferase
MQPAYEYLKSHPEAANWWTYLFIHEADQKLIGLGGYKGPPTEDGSVELGYAIAPAYRQKGLATEAARGMLEYAFSNPAVKRVVAHTLPEPNASTRVLERIGMKHLGAIEDPQDGVIWRWRVSREDY